MKQVILTLALALSTSAFAQIAPPKQRILLNLPKPAGAPDVRIGPAMMLGGASFVVAGLLTPPTMVGWSTTEKQPFYKQIRMLPILTGTIVFTIGAGNTLGGN
jgi:hypothetical protein